jgi:hypothetical protein
MSAFAGVDAPDVDELDADGFFDCPAGAAVFPQPTAGRMSANANTAAVIRTCIDIMVPISLFRRLRQHAWCAKPRLQPSSVIVDRTCVLKDSRPGTNTPPPACKPVWMKDVDLWRKVIDMT